MVSQQQPVWVCCSTNLPEMVLSNAGLEQPVLLGTTSLAVAGTGQFCEKEPCGSSWRKKFREISLPPAFLVTDSRELCYSRTRVVLAG